MMCQRHNYDTLRVVMSFTSFSVMSFASLNVMISLRENYDKIAF